MSIEMGSLGYEEGNVTTDLMKCRVPTAYGVPVQAGLASQAAFVARL